LVLQNQSAAKARSFAVRFGDLLRDLRNPNLSKQRLDEIVRIFNELGDREEKYRGWLQFANGQPRISTPTIGDPVWTGSPLNLCVAQRLADTSVAHNTNHYITFDKVRQFGTAFAVSEDKTKLHWNALDARGFSIDGFVTWAANGTGYRAAYLEGFNASGVSLGTAPLHTFPGNGLVDNVLPISFKYYFNDFAYLKFFVAQTSGAPLTMKDFLIGATLA
jgi:hypothetical protein